MATFKEANQARLSLKMKLFDHYWYDGSSVETDGDDYCIFIYVSKLDNEVKKVIPPVYESVSVRTDIFGKKSKKK